MGDRVNHPDHYNQVPGIECIDVVEHFPFNRGNAIKYLWRAGEKGDLVEDLRKAIWYIEREIAGVIKSHPEKGSDRTVSTATADSADASGRALSQGDSRAIVSHPLVSHDAH